MTEKDRDSGSVGAGKKKGMQGQGGNAKLKRGGPQPSIAGVQETGVIGKKKGEKRNNSTAVCGRAKVKERLGGGGGVPLFRRR